MSDFVASGMPWKILNFLLFAGALAFGLRRSVAEFWRSRKETLTFEIDEAMRSRKEAGKTVYDLEMRLTRLDEETTELIRTLKDEGELEKKKMIQDATRLAQQAREDSRRIMAQELGRAREGLRRQVTDLSIAIAERIFREKFSATDQRRLNERHLKELEAGV